MSGRAAFRRSLRWIAIFSEIIYLRFALGKESPEVGRPFPDLPELREFKTEFGDSGYVARYRYERADEAAYILAFRHQKEAGY